MKRKFGVAIAAAFLASALSGCALLLPLPIVLPPATVEEYLPPIEPDAVPAGVAIRVVDGVVELLMCRDIEAAQEMWVSRLASAEEWVDYVGIEGIRSLSRGDVLVTGAELDGLTGFNDPVPGAVGTMIFLDVYGAHRGNSIRISSPYPPFEAEDIEQRLWVFSDGGRSKSGCDHYDEAWS